MALMAAINVIFSFLTVAVPFLSVALIIFLPLTSAIVEITCKDRYFPIYAFATIGLSIVVTLESFDFTIFYVVPSIITGYLFGLFSKKNMPAFIALFAASVVQTAISLAFVPFIKFIFSADKDVIDYFCTLFNITDREYFNNFVILIFFLVALIQTILSYIVVNNELTRMKAKTPSNKDWTFVVNVSLISSIILMVIFSFFYLPISYVCLGFAWFFAAFSLYYSIMRKDKVLIICIGSTLLVNLFLFGALNHLFQRGYEFLLLGIAPLLAGLLSLGFYFLKKQKQ